MTVSQNVARLGSPSQNLQELPGTPPFQVWSMNGLEVWSTNLYGVWLRVCRQDVSGQQFETVRSELSIRKNNLRLRNPGLEFRRLCQVHIYKMRPYGSLAIRSPELESQTLQNLLCRVEATGFMGVSPRNTVKAYNKQFCTLYVPRQQTATLQGCGILG